MTPLFDRRGTVKPQSEDVLGVRGRVELALSNVDGTLFYRSGPESRADTGHISHFDNIEWVGGGTHGKPATLPQGRKDDAGKLDMTLLDDMPRALKAVVQVMQWAIEDKKPVPYERGSWLGVGVERYRAAAARHRRDAAEQASAPNSPVQRVARKERDKETELLHLAHETVSNLFALELTLRELENERG